VEGKGVRFFFSADLANLIEIGF